MKRSVFMSAMLMAFQAGKDYWRLADSERPRDHSKADEVYREFRQKLEDIAKEQTEEDEDAV